MENERLILAIGRIERSLSRIEAANGVLGGSGTDEALERRHTALKQEMQQTIEKIDGMIARQEQ